jgi:hypothetical protein
MGTVSRVGNEHVEAKQDQNEQSKKVQQDEHRVKLRPSSPAPRPTRRSTLLHGRSLSAVDDLISRVRY